MTLRLLNKSEHDKHDPLQIAEFTRNIFETIFQRVFQKMPHGWLKRAKSGGVFWGPFY